MTDADEVITLPVPEMVDAIYLVAARNPSDDVAGRATQLAAGRFSEGLREQVTAWLAAPFPLQLRPVSQMPPPPLELLAASGATDEQLDRIRQASHLAVIGAKAPPAGPPVHAWVARAMAVLIAEALSGDIIDVLTYQVFTPAEADATLPGADGRARLADWVVAEYSPDRHGYWCTTNGLRRYGLPELQTLTTPPNVVEEWGSALTGAAYALLVAWRGALDADPDAAFVELPAALRIRADDVAAAYGRPARGGPAAVVRLTLDPRGPDHHSFLTIHPPLDWSGSAGEHIAEVCATLFGARPNEVRHAHPSEAMDEAIATARAGLGRVRVRFESGELDLHTKLLVKYALPADVGIEYLWAYVTSWRDPDRILATNAADSLYQAKVRAGRPVVVDAASVVDWAVEHDERGIIEGAWTQAALDQG